jgi:hypothetical protein
MSVVAIGTILEDYRQLSMKWNCTTLSEKTQLNACV